MIERILKAAMQFLGMCLVAGFLFWMLLQGIDQHQEAITRLHTPPIERHR